ncbi:short-chain_dehydrogenase [Hexamita inflata]|uniref:Short-chain dehydrogenase n=1 Tax=Hexamita inflata TaxID=28002 RepID=A0AA86TSE8_9EUKA|nr:short-chain dehydrogenase [Hexamita inflata]
MIDNRSYIDQLKAKFGSGPILITGATGSVGFELVRNLCKDFKIIAVGRDLDKLAQLRELGAETIPLDLSQQMGDGILEVEQLSPMQNNKLIHYYQFTYSLFQNLYIIYIYPLLRNMVVSKFHSILPLQQVITFQIQYCISLYIIFMYVYFHIPNYSNILQLNIEYTYTETYVL